MRRTLLCLLLIVAALLERPALGQSVAPPLNPAVTQRIEADYLSDDERRELRIFHGLWTDDDLDSPARRARAALIVGAIDDPSLRDPATPTLDRADAMLQRGELKECLDLLSGDSSIRGIRLRADALAGLGRFADADAALDPLVDRMAREKLDVEQLVEGVRGLILRTQIRGSARGGGEDDRQILSLLNKARDEMDRLAWPVRLAEAELLYSRHNSPEAAAAATEVLALNPRCAAAYALLGRMAVDGFNFDASNAIADQLDDLARDFDAVSAEAEQIRARALLRQRQAPQANEYVEILLGAYPMHRAGLALSAAAAAGSYDDQRTADVLAFIDQVSPGSPLGWYEVGRVQSETRQYAAAAESLAEAIRRQPNWSAPHIELGLMEMQSGDDQAALDDLKAAMKLDPFNARAANSLKLIEQLASYNSIQSPHFTVRYRPGIDEALARDMPAILERIYARVCGDGPGGIRFEPDRRTVVELMPNHEWFAVRITGMPSIHTMAASTGPVIAMESPQEGPGFMVGPYDWARVVQHEFTHTVTLARTRNRIGHWMTEAAAVFNEDSPRDSDTWKLLAHAFENDDLFDMDSINIGFVRPKKPSDRALAYAQGHWMYQYIIERWGPRAPLDLMDRAAAGMPESDAFAAVLGVDHDAFLAQFKDWARQQLLDRELLLPSQTPSLEELLGPWTGRWADRGTPPTADERLDALRDLAEQHPDHPDVLEALILAETEETNGEPTAQLVPTLEHYAQLRPTDDLPHRLLSRWYLTQDDRAERLKAIEHLEFLDRRQTTSAAYAAELAKLWVEDGDLDKAGRYAERAATIAPFDADQREFAARVALLRKDYAAAERHILALTIIEPDREQHKKRLAAVRALIDRQLKDDGQP